ncbi:MAG: hypothetical protein ABFD65_03105 [Candidatus Polarisedimenticolia bacterium]
MDQDIFGFIYMLLIALATGLGLVVVLAVEKIVDGFRTIGSRCYMSELLTVADRKEFLSLAHWDWAEGIIRADRQDIAGKCDDLAVSLCGVFAAAMGSDFLAANYKRRLVLDRVLTPGQYNASRELAVRRAAYRLVR